MQQTRTPGRQDDAHTGKRWGRKLVLGFFLFIGAVALLESPLTRVRSVTVTGNHSIPAADILAAAPIHKGMSLWQVNQSSTQHDVTDKQPMISNVSIQTDVWSGAVVLHVTEKHIVAILESSGKFYNLLNDGKVYGEMSAVKGFIWPIVTMDTPLSVKTGSIPTPALATLCQQLSSSNMSTTNQISEIHVDTYGDASIYLNNGFVAACKVNSFASTMSSVGEAVQYFLEKGFAPGLVDMTGAPPYRYTPFPQGAKKGGQP